MGATAGGALARVEPRRRRRQRAAAPKTSGSRCDTAKNRESMTLEDLPSPVLEGLRRLAADASARGIRLFLFGSFARGDARPNSDLDLGYEMQGGIQPANRIWLLDAVDALPTIRPIDLVDFAGVSPAFRNVALADQRDLQ